MSSNHLVVPTLKAKASGSSLCSLQSQVGGHPGVMASEDGAVVIKPCLLQEREFYELLAKDDARLAPLIPFVPRFLGTLRLEGQVKDTTKFEEMNGLATVATAVNIEQGLLSPPSENEEKDKHSRNVCFGLGAPNIMDIKLGTVLYDDTASPEKRERMIKSARETTSFETGIRLTGFQVYENKSGIAEVMPKSYGRSIKVSDLPDGFRRFFPLAESTKSSCDVGVSETVKTKELSFDAISEQDMPENEGTKVGAEKGLPRDLLFPVLQGLLKDVRAIRAALQCLEIRMVGASLLVVYEADWGRARETLDHSFGGTRTSAADATASSGGSGPSVSVELCGAPLAASSIQFKDPSLMEEDTSIDEEEYEEEDEEEQRACAAKLIDFAHTRLVVGEGPDMGVLKGLDTIILLLEGRIREVEQRR